MKNSKSIVEPYLNKEDWRVKESSSCPFSYGGMTKYSSAEVFKDYWLREVYPEYIATAYVDGHIHIHDLGGLTLYTYFGKEVIIVKSPDGIIKMMSLEDFYKQFVNNESCVNITDDVWQARTDGWLVLDKGGWTAISVVTRKKKHRQMHFIKSDVGRSVIVTDNHPMITANGEKTAAETTLNDKLYTADLSKLLNGENLFAQKYLDLLKIMPEYIGKNKVYADGYPIAKMRDTQHVMNVHTQQCTLPRFIPLTSDFGFAIGFILAEGFLSYNDYKHSKISINNKSQDDIARVVKGFSDVGCTCTVNAKDKNMWTLEMSNIVMIDVIKSVFGIKCLSRNKNLPNDILNYNKSFVYGVISGIIDGDGNINGTEVNIRVSARTMIEQMGLVLQMLGICVRDRKIEGQGSQRELNGRIITQRYPLYGIGFNVQDENISSRKYIHAKKAVCNYKNTELDTWHKVVNNVEVNIPDEYIYDITTETHTLLVNGMYNHNCCGYSLKDILKKGVKGVSVIPRSAPAKHFDSALNQIANMTTVFQNEIMGAVAYNGFDTLLAPFIKKDHKSYEDIKQAMQNFIFSINSNSRGGAEPAFSNITFDLTPPRDMLDTYAMVGGEKVDFTYRECQKEMDMLNRAFFEIMLGGDYDGKLFSYPIPTYNIHERFDWDNPNNDLLWEMAGKYGTPYFSNFINSDLHIEDVRSMCCRLRLDLSELRHRNGGLFGAGDSTGSIGVVTINLPRLGYENKGDRDTFFAELDKYLDIAKNSLEIKREWLQEHSIKDKLIPAFVEYVGTLKNHFSTIGIIGMNEMCENFMGKDILDDEAHKFCLEVGEHIRKKLLEYQEETGHLYNYEATPAESTCYRFALADKKAYPDIITQGSGKDIYYTNSCHIPVSKVTSINETFKHQEDLQLQFTGGTVIHIYLKGAISGEQAKSTIRTMFENYKVPYVTLSPISRYCEEHKYITEITDTCPKCGKPLKMYQRITGYLREVGNFNRGKTAEFNDRNQL